MCGFIITQEAIDELREIGNGWRFRHAGDPPVTAHALIERARAVSRQQQNLGPRTAAANLVDERKSATTELASEIGIQQDKRVIMFAQERIGIARSGRQISRHAALFQMLEERAG